MTLSFVILRVVRGRSLSIQLRRYLRLRSAMVRERTYRLLKRTNPFALAVKRVVFLAELSQKFIVSRSRDEIIHGYVTTLHIQVAIQLRAQEATAFLEEPNPVPFR